MIAHTKVTNVEPVLRVVKPTDVHVDGCFFIVNFGQITLGRVRGWTPQQFCDANCILPCDSRGIAGTRSTPSVSVNCDKLDDERIWLYYQCKFWDQLQSQHAFCFDPVCLAAITGCAPVKLCTDGDDTSAVAFGNLFNFSMKYGIHNAKALSINNWIYDTTREEEHLCDTVLKYVRRELHGPRTFVCQHCGEEKTFVSNRGDGKFHCTCPCRGVHYQGGRRRGHKQHSMWKLRSDVTDTQIAEYKAKATL
jgi:hypothetical protein